MRITFRQGIARCQTDINGSPVFLQKSAFGAQYIDLIVSPDPTIIIFAHYGADYVLEEARTVTKAWGPFPDTQTAWLYWDVNVLTAALTRGFTYLPPIISGVPPTDPVVDQHWFDSVTTVMKVWNGSKWIEKIRVFAATYVSSAVIKPYPLGSQVGIEGEFETGNIVLDSYFKPLRQSDGSFVTSTTNMSVTTVATKRVRFEAEIMSLMATEYVPMFSCVQVAHGRNTLLARSTDVLSRVGGIAMDDMYAGETAIIATSGIVRYEGWTWPSNKVGRPIFCGPTGELVLTPPTTGVLQQVGYIYDTDSIFVQIFPPVILTDPFAVLPPSPPPPTQAPVADFTIVPFETVGNAPFTVQFQDQSTNNPTAWEWDFTNDGSVDSTLQNPSYTFSTPGTYTVRLRATNGYGWDDGFKPNFITVNEPPPPAGKTNLEVTLTGPLQVARNELFTLTVTVRNDGLLTATNVVRTVNLYDVGTSQAVPSGLPEGSTVTRETGYTTVTLPLVGAIISGASVPISFTVQAPTLPVRSPLRPGGTVTSYAITITARATSPEVDVNEADNTTSLLVPITT